MGDIFIDPTDGCRSFVVVADVAHKLAREILYGIEDTSRNYVALNFGKPNFDLVIGNDVDLATWRLACYDLCKEIDELCAGVACTGFSQHLSGLGVQGAVERKRSMAVVLEAMPFGPAGRKGENPGQALQRLDGTLLLDTEYSNLHRRVLGSAEDVRRL